MKQCDKGQYKISAAGFQCRVLDTRIGEENQFVTREKSLICFLPGGSLLCD